MVKHIDFSINQKTSVQELVKVLDFSRQEKQPRPGIEPGSPDYKPGMLTNTPLTLRTVRKFFFE